MRAPPFLYYFLSVSVLGASGFRLLVQPSRVRLPEVDCVKKCRLCSTKNGEDIPAVYPLSRRKVMLIQEAKKLDPSIASGGNIGSYSPVGWSNRLGSVLTPASIPGVYTADRPFYWNNIDVGCRMTVVQLESGKSGEKELVVHSPVGLDPPLIQALEQLGKVAHVISPNYEHVKYAPQWAQQFPEAKMWGCPGMTEREPEIRWTGDIPYGARPPGFASSAIISGKCSAENEIGVNGMWDWAELQPLHIDTEVNPFTGRPFFNEVIFYHTKSKTILTTDLYWNYPRGDGVTNGQVFDEIGNVVASSSDENDFGVWDLAPDVGSIPLGSRVWKVGMDKVFKPFYMNLMVKGDKKESFENIAKYITCGGSRDGWEVETIVPAHGDIVRSKATCRRVLENHFNIRCS